MRKRNHRVQFMLNESEYLRLKNYSARSGLSHAGYLRKFIKGYVPKELPPLEYYEIIKQLYKIYDKLSEIKSCCNSPPYNEEFNQMTISLKGMIIQLHHSFFDEEKI